jgi:uncharacterized membrane protein YcaP (DUF421 family)
LGKALAAIPAVGKEQRQSMFSMSVGIAEHVFRVVIVYVVLYVGLRFGGKKHVGELSPFDLVVLLILSETVQNAMIGDDTSLTGGLVSAMTLLVLAQATGYATWRSKRFGRTIEGVPKILVRHGHCCEEVMAREQVSISELTSAMRQQGCANITDIRIALLENDGRISIIKRTHGKEGQEPHREVPEPTAS